MNRNFQFIISVLALAVVLLLPQQQASAQWVLLDAKADAMVRAGLDATYNLQYNKADSIFNRMAVEYPNHPAGYFLLALVDWWRIVPNMDAEIRANKFSSIFDERRYSKSFNDRIDKTLEICDQRLDSNPADIVALFFKGSALGYRSRLTFARGFDPSAIFEWASAIPDGIEAYRIILKCQQMAPSNSDVLLGSGLYNYISAWLEENHPTEKRTFAGFLPPGDRKIGLQMLRIAASKAQYAAVEAQYSLLEFLSSNNFEKDYSGALEVSTELHRKYPSNPIFYKYQAKNLYMVGRLNEADSAWTDIINRVVARQTGYELPVARQGLYYLGDIRLRTGKYENAIKLFEQVVEQSKRMGDDESSWIVQANLKIGNAYDKLQRRNDAIRQYKKVISMDEYSGSRDKAKGYLDKPFQ